MGGWLCRTCGYGCRGGRRGRYIRRCPECRGAMRSARMVRDCRRGGCRHRRTGPTLPDGCAMCLDCGARVEPRLWSDGLNAWESPHHPGEGL